MSIDPNLAIALIDPDCPKPVARFDSQNGQVHIQIGDNSWTLPAQTVVNIMERWDNPNLAKEVEQAEHWLNDQDEQITLLAALEWAQRWTPADIGLCEDPAGSGQWRFTPGDPAWASIHLEATDPEVRFAVDLCTQDGYLLTAKLGVSRPGDLHLTLDHVTSIPWGLQGHRDPNLIDLGPNPLGAIHHLDLPTVLVRLPLYAQWEQDVQDFVRGYTERRETAEQQHHQVEQEWRRLCRSKQRIPNSALIEWCRQASHIDYTNNGLAVGGWRVDPIALISKQRPKELDRDRHPVGNAQVWYAVRIEHFDARFRRHHRRENTMRFYDSETQRLRDALPGCVIKVPEDKRALFVAYDLPDYVEAIDAAIAEWVLVGPPDLN